MALPSWQSRRLLQSCAQLPSLSTFRNRDCPTWQACKRWYGSGDKAETDSAEEHVPKAGLGPASDSDGKNDQRLTAARRDIDGNTREPAAKGPQSSGIHSSLQDEGGQGGMAVRKSRASES